MLHCKESRKSGEIMICPVDNCCDLRLKESAFCFLLLQHGTSFAVSWVYRVDRPENAQKADALDSATHERSSKTMRWRDQRQSQNVEDQRGVSGKGLAVGGGLGTIVIMVLALLFGADPRQLLEQATRSGGGAPTTQTSRPTTPAEEEEKKFVSTVLASTEDVWQDILRQRGLQYREPKLVLFADQIRSPCGLANSAVGPFYCPGDQKVYIDLTFFHELKSRFRAPGDFAQAYVVAHEVGHHLQQILGTMDKVNAMRSRLSEAEANQLSVRVELQADFYAGVWAHYAQKKGILEPGDVEEALRAASAIGDDRLQRESQGYVVPDSFTHGTSEQRVRWFRRGLETGDIRQGDTFNARSL
jgi:predicted metalloprotease